MSLYHPFTRHMVEINTKDSCFQLTQTGCHGQLLRRPSDTQWVLCSTADPHLTPRTRHHVTCVSGSLGLVHKSPSAAFIKHQQWTSETFPPPTCGFSHSGEIKKLFAFAPRQKHKIHTAVSDNLSAVYSWSGTFPTYILTINFPVD